MIDSRLEFGENYGQHEQRANAAVPTSKEGLAPMNVLPASQNTTPENQTFSARHSMDSPEWYTPTPFVEAARRTMGSIDLDPASHPEANARIQATRIYTEHDNGLIQPWDGNVFLNPPGGFVAPFWARAVSLYLNGAVKQLIWIGYSLEQLQTLQQSNAPMQPLEFPIMFTAKRIAFVENEAKKAARIAKLIAAGKKPNTASSPSHSNYICYMGPNVREFAKEFGVFGKVVAR